MEVIITNLSIDNKDFTIADHQSYLYDIDSWESYVKSYEDRMPFDIPQGLLIKDLCYDNHHLSCVLINELTGFKTIKLAHKSDYVIVQ